MSYARCSDQSDVYVYDTDSGDIECCGCILGGDCNTFPSWDQMAQHLRQHQQAGHAVPQHLLTVQPA